MKGEKLQSGNAIFIVLLAAMNLCRNFLWLTPSAMMAPIIEELTLSYAQVGQLSLIVTVLMGVFLIAGSTVLERVGPLQAIVIGQCCIAIDGFCSYLGPTFFLVMAGKVFSGIGYGLTSCASTALIAALFRKEQLGIINAVNACITNLTISAAYQFIVPLSTGLGSWRTESLVLGVFALIMVVPFMLWGRNKRVSAAPARTGNRGNALAEALSYPSVRAFVIVISFSMLVYVSMSSYYPNYLHQQKGFPVDTASAMVSVISIAGMVGSLFVGAIIHRILNGKLYLLVTLTGTVASFAGMVFLKEYYPLRAALCCFGFFYCALSSFCTTSIMRLPDISPITASAGVSLTAGFGSLLAIVVPSVQQELADRLGLMGAMMSFFLLFIPSAVGIFLLPQEKTSSKTKV